jgi:YidC/Oxa1 family membrane protein insertase
VAIGGAVSGRRAYSLWPSGWGLGSKPASTTPPSPTPEQAVPSPSATAVPAPEPIMEIAPVAASNPAAPPNPLDTIDVDNLLLDAESLLNMDESIGYLKAMGLDYGWGPSSMMQWLLEHIHIWSGTPWWGTIALTALAVRLIVYKPTLVGMDHSTRLQILRQDPEFAKLQKEYQMRVTAEGLSVATSQLKTRMAKYYKQHNVKPFLAFASLVQIPLGYGLFRVLHGASKLPVPAMETGGILWFQDLTAADPFYILPIVGPVAMFAMMTVSRNSLFHHDYLAGLVLSGSRLLTGNS